MRSSKIHLALAALSLPALLAGNTLAETPATRPAVTRWANWRGPFYNGTSDASALPDKLSPETNLLWSTPLPGISNATPIVAAGHVYVSAFDPATKKLRAVSVDAATGKIDWQHDVADAPGPNPKNSYATPSATIDDHGVIFTFGTGDIVAYDPAGNTRWSRKLSTEFGTIRNDWVYSSSPLLLNDTLYIQALQRSTSFLAALNPADGKTKWRKDRPTDAVGESHDAYTTPLPLVTKEATQILLLGGDFLSAHDPDSGKELWRFGGFNPAKHENWRVIPSPVTDGQRAYITVARGAATLAVKTGGTGDITATHQAWNLDGVGSDSPTPALSAGILYVLDDRKTLHAVDAATGVKKTSLKLGEGAFYSSPTIADGKMYCISESAEVVILSLNPLSVISRTTLDDKGSVRSSITPIDGRLFIRTGTKLWCFGNK